MNKLNKIRLTTAALIVSFAVAVPLAVAIDTGSFEMPSARAAVAQTHRPQARTASARPAATEEVIVMPETVIVATRHEARKTPCEARDEGVRALTQGRGTVRTFTFCH